jgi:hypothetical protein
MAVKPSPPAPPRRLAQPGSQEEPEESSEEDVVTQLRGKLEDARDAIDEALALIEEE